MLNMIFIAIFILLFCFLILYIKRKYRNRRDDVNNNTWIENNKYASESLFEQKSDNIIKTSGVDNQVYIPQPHFSSGDVVRLKSGGPNMIVNQRRVCGGGWFPTYFEMDCSWYDEFNRLHKESFNQNLLVKVDK